MAITRKFETVADYPSGYDLIRLRPNEALLHPPHIALVIGTLWRDRAPMSTFESRRLLLPDKGRWRQEWNMYYSIDAGTIVYSIPYFPYTGITKWRSTTLNSPSGWPSSGKCGPVVGTPFWTNGIGTFPDKNVAPGKRDELLEEDDDFKRLISLGWGLWCRPLEVLLIKHPRVYDQGEVVRIRTEAGDFFFDARYLDFAASILYGTYMTIRVGRDLQDVSLCYRLFRGKRRQIVSVVKPIKLRKYGEIIIKKLTGEEKCAVLE